MRNVLPYLFEALLRTMAIAGLLLMLASMADAVMYVFAGVQLMSGPQSYMALQTGASCAGIAALLLLPKDIRNITKR